MGASFSSRLKIPPAVAGGRNATTPLMFGSKQGPATANAGSERKSYLTG